jgi:hypothetical protein
MYCSAQASQSLRRRGKQENTLDDFMVCVQVSPAGYNLTTVAVDGGVIVAPKRSWLFPPSLLLPNIPIRATIKLGVRGSLETGKVCTN